MSCYVQCEVCEEDARIDEDGELCERCECEECPFQSASFRAEDDDGVPTEIDFN